MESRVSRLSRHTLTHFSIPAALGEPLISGVLLQGELRDNQLGNEGLALPWPG